MYIIACAQYITQYIGTTSEAYMNGKTLDECQSECLERSDCEYYAFSPIQGRCYLYSEVTGMWLNRGMIAGHQSCHLNDTNSK